MEILIVAFIVSLVISIPYFYIKYTNQHIKPDTQTLEKKKSEEDDDFALFIMLDDNDD